MKTNFSGKTTYPNTKETDMMEEVMHTVSYRDNGVEKEVNIMAKDPSDAINKVMKEVKE